MPDTLPPGTYTLRIVERTVNVNPDGSFTERVKGYAHNPSNNLEHLVEYFQSHPPLIPIMESRTHLQITWTRKRWRDVLEALSDSINMTVNNAGYKPQSLIDIHDELEELLDGTDS